MIHVVFKSFGLLFCEINLVLPFSFPSARSVWTMQQMSSSYQVATCYKCGIQLEQCPICRIKIESVQRYYIVELFTVITYIVNFVYLLWFIIICARYHFTLFNFTVVKCITFLFLHIYLFYQYLFYLLQGAIVTFGLFFLS
jgi:hypothetical protein